MNRFDWPRRSRRWHIIIQISTCTEAQTATLILFLISKMTIAGGTLIIFQFGGELYPTEVRGVGIGLASFLGGIALTIIPFINHLVSSGSSGPRWRPHSFSAGLDDLISAAVHGLLRC
jgi:hypothetical protein